MFSSRKFILPFFVYLSIFFAAAEAHEQLVQRRDHVNLNSRMLKKRAPQDSDGGLLGGAVVGAAPTPDSSSTVSAATTSTTSGSASSTSSTPASVTSSGTTSSVATSSSAASSSSSEANTSASLAVTQAPNDSSPGVSTVIVGGKTRTSSIAASESSSVPNAGSNLGASSSGGATLTALIIVAASIGGIFIVWTIFRKWKLASSKKFDRRLNPIESWDPKAGNDDDGAIPGSNRPRPPSVISNHSSAHGSGHGHGAVNQNPFDDFDGPAKPVGGYADLSRGPSGGSQMQEKYGAATYGRAYGAGTNGVPLHHGY